jgi:hypothetical protein
LYPEWSGCCSPNSCSSVCFTLSMSRVREARMEKISRICWCAASSGGCEASPSSRLGGW